MKHSIKKNYYLLPPGKLSFDDITFLLDNDERIQISKDDYKKINQSRELVVKAINSQKNCVWYKYWFRSSCK
jgi:histidine ammonia-lyase